MCLFHFDYFDEALKKVTMARRGSLATTPIRQRRHDLHQVQER